MLAHLGAHSKPHPVVSEGPVQSPLSPELSSLVSAGVHLTRVKRGGKAPIDAGYQTLHISDDSAADHLSQGGSLGGNMGRKSNNIVCVDVDGDAQTRTQLDPKLSKTRRSWRDNASDRERRFVRIIGKLPHSFKDHKAGLELIADRGHAVLIGTHQTGAEIKLDDAPIVEMTADELMAILQPWRTSPTDAPDSGTQRLDATARNDPEDLLIHALETGTPGNRNEACFTLACGLRDARLTREDAASFIRRYQSSVENSGNHPFTREEALRCLESAYSRLPRCVDPVDAVLDGLERAIVAGKVLIPANVRKTLCAVIEVMRDVKGVYDVALPVRTLVAKTGNSRSTIHDHLRHLRSRHLLLTREVAGNTTVASRYSLTKYAQSYTNFGQSMHAPELPELSEIDNFPAYDGGEVSMLNIDRVTDVYRTLKMSPLTVSRARIDVRLAENANMATWTFGPNTLAILAVLGSGPFSTVASVAQAALLSRSTALRHLRHLVDSGLVQKTKEGYQLTPNWRELANSLAPALSTFGRLELRARQACIERQCHHNRLEQFLCGEMQDVARDTVKHAQSDERFWDAHCNEANKERKEYGLALGLEADAIPPIALTSSRGGQPRIQQPYSAAKAGRKVIPEGRTRQVNGARKEQACILSTKGHSTHETL